MLGAEDKGQKSKLSICCQIVELCFLGSQGPRRALPIEIQSVHPPVEGTCVLNSLKAEIPPSQEWQRQKDAKSITVPAETVAGKEAWNDLHILSICLILKHKLISHMHKHEHLILKSHNLGHLEIWVDIFYLKRIWKEKKMWCSWGCLNCSSSFHWLASPLGDRRLWPSSWMSFRPHEVCTLSHTSVLFYTAIVLLFLPL